MKPVRMMLGGELWVTMLLPVVVVLAFGNRCRTCVRTRRAICTARSASASADRLVVARVAHHNGIIAQSRLLFRRHLRTQMNGEQGQQGADVVRAIEVNLL